MHVLRKGYLQKSATNVCNDGFDAKISEGHKKHVDWLPKFPGIPINSLTVQDKADLLNYTIQPPVFMLITPHFISVLLHFRRKKEILATLAGYFANDLAYF